MWAVLLYFSVAVAIGQSSDICPATCVCDGLIVACSQVDADFLQNLHNWTELSGEHLKISDSSRLKVVNFTDQLVLFLRGFKRLTITSCAVELIIGDESSQLPDVTELTLDDNYFIDDSSIPVIRAIFPQLISLSLKNNYVGILQTDGEIGLSQFAHLQFVGLSGNQLRSLPLLPNTVRRVDLSANLIGNISSQLGLGAKNLSHLDLSRNQLKTFDFRLLRVYGDLLSLNLSGNLISSMTWFTGVPPGNLRLLDVSRNRLESFDTQLLSHLPKLRDLNMTGNRLDQLMTAFPYHEQLENIWMESTAMEFLFLRNFASLINIKSLSLAYSPNLHLVFGGLSKLSSLESLSFRRCNFSAFPPDFLKELPSALRQLDISANPLLCDCRGQWMRELSSENSKVLVNLNETVCTGPEGNIGMELAKVIRSDFAGDICRLGIYGSPSGIQVVLGRYGKEIKLKCPAYGDPTPSIVWRPSKYSSFDSNRFVFTWNATTDTSEEPINNSFGVAIVPGGALVIRSPNRSHISRFECAAINEFGNATTVISFKLDYTEWRISMLYSCLCGVATAIGFCILNIIYGCLRQLIVWRLSKVQQNSRVRMMVEALEKYKERQTEALQQTYAKRVEAIRDNYHNQADMLRRSYAAQVERFRDYRVAQIGTVSQHFDSIRDNYNTQVGRIGYYGGRQMERLFDSYQQQINRIRSFTLQQRLRLMRTYKIKQRYFDKILHGLNMESSADYPRESDLFSGPDRIPQMPQFPGAEELLASDHLEPLALGLMGQEMGGISLCDGISIGKTVDYETSDDVSISTYHSFGMDDLDEIPPLVPAADIPWLRGGSSRPGSRRSRAAPSPQPRVEPIGIEVDGDESQSLPTNNSTAALLEKETNC